MSGTRRLAVFDLDGTISRRDTFVPFVVGLFLKRPWRLPRLLIALPALAGYPLKLSDRGRLKAALARAAFGGLSRTDIDRLAADHVVRVQARGIFPEALAAIAAHRAAGDHLVLMSASPDLYIPQLAAALGFDDVVCTRLGWSHDRFTGQLESANCRGPEKLRQLEQLKMAHPGLRTIGYGNSRPDLDHLVHCDEAVYVNARGAERSRLLALGLRLADWH